MSWGNWKGLGRSYLGGDGRGGGSYRCVPRGGAGGGRGSPIGGWLWVTHGVAMEYLWVVAMG